MNEEIKKLYILLLTKDDLRIEVHITQDKNSVYFKTDEFFVADQTIGWEGVNYTMASGILSEVGREQMFDWGEDSGKVTAIWDSFDELRD